MKIKKIIHRSLITLSIYTASCFCVSSCGNSSLLLGDSEPIQYEGSLRAAPISFPNLAISVTNSFVGSVERGTVQSNAVTVENNSTVNVNENFYVSAYILNTASGVRQWLKSWKIASLNAGSVSSLNTVVTIPSNSSLGDTIIEYWVDKSNKISEFNEADNLIKLGGITIIERLQKTDLFIAVDNFDEISRSLRLKIYNLGAGKVNSEIFFYKIYLSFNDTILDSNDVLLYSGDNFSNGSYVTIAQNLFFQEEVFIPTFSLINPGDYHFIMVVDSSNKFQEENEVNNQISFFIKTVN